MLVVCRHNLHRFRFLNRMRSSIGLALAFTVALGFFTGRSEARQVEVWAQKRTFPEWSRNMLVWPFDLLFPTTSDEEMVERIEAARSEGANVLIFYIEEEHMYGTFVDEAGFSAILPKIWRLAGLAHEGGMKVVCYVNGLEVMTHHAATDPALPSMYRDHPDWVQKDISGKDMVWYGLDYDWVTPDMEDAWICPLSPYRELFKKRLSSLAQQGVDGIYIDATFLPGIQPGPNRIWACADSRCRSEFLERTGLSIPTAEDWTSDSWRRWITFRHEIIAEYLGDLAAHAWSVGLVPFWESSTGDTAEGTLLGNESAYVVRGDISFSPEIEGEAWSNVFRLAKFAHDLDPSRPMLFLGWPATADAARREFAITLCESNNYYPTADSPWPREAFQFIDKVQSSILSKRIAFSGIAMIYSVRNKDFTFTDDRHFDSYKAAFDVLSSRHLPFRVLVLENLESTQLADLNALVLSDVPSISDSEYGLLNTKPVYLVGEVGTRDEDWKTRTESLTFDTTVSLDQLTQSLPYSISAPSTTKFEFYRDATKASRHMLFAYNDELKGQIVIQSASPLVAEIHTPRGDKRRYSGKEIRIDLPPTDPLMILDLTLSSGNRVPR